MFDRIGFSIMMFIIAFGLYLVINDGGVKNEFKYTVCGEFLKHDKTSGCIYSNVINDINDNCIKINNVIICGSYIVIEKNK